MNSHRLVLLLFTVVCLFLAQQGAGCFFDPMGSRSSSADADGVTDGDADSDVDGDTDGDVDGDTDGDADGDTDGDADDETPPACEPDEVACSDSENARVCEDGSWVDVGACFLGCEPEAALCRVPSNVDVDTLRIDESALSDLLFPADSSVSVNTDDGSILNDTASSTIREPLEDAILAGVGFYLQRQDDDAPPLGVFVVHDLTIPETTTVTITGSAAVVVLATGAVTIDGTVDGGANAQRGGSGGGDGGAAESAGTGLCPGAPGGAVSTCPHVCASGSGGGGYSGAGGDGSAVDCHVAEDIVIAAGAGGGLCGNAELIPLQGGSGGAGGPAVPDETSTDPGSGGGGGGAIQISARGSLTIGATAVITVPGGGGGETISAGGAGGGSGGAVLLEAPVITTAATAIIAANGGGGGGGDCT